MARSATVVRGLAVALVVWAGAIDPGVPWALSVVEARAEEGWKAEYAEICSKTQDAMVLTTAELRSLIARCDKLKPAIDGLDETLRKVYSRKLKTCRDLYQFVLESRGEA